MSFKVFNSILGRLHGNFQQYYPFSCVAPNLLAHFSKSIALKHRKLLLNIKMFPVHKRVEQLKMNHMFNIIHGISPAYLKEDISLQDNANHQTRSVTSLSCQTPRVNSFGLKSFFYTAIKSWNSLPFSLRSINMKQSFKNILKTSIWNQLRSENQELYIYY